MVFVRVIYTVSTDALVRIVLHSRTSVYGTVVNADANAEYAVALENVAGMVTATDVGVFATGVIAASPKQTIMPLLNLT